MASTGLWTPGTSSGAQASVAPLALAQATSWKLPALRSAWVTVWVPVQIVDAPTATLDPLAGAQLKASRVGVSLTVMDCGTLPVLVAVIVKVITWPTWL